MSLQYLLTKVRCTGKIYKNEEILFDDRQTRSYSITKYPLVIVLGYRQTDEMTDQLKQYLLSTFAFLNVDLLVIYDADTDNLAICYPVNGECNFHPISNDITLNRCDVCGNYYLYQTTARRVFSVENDKPIELIKHPHCLYNCKIATDTFVDVCYGCMFKSVIPSLKDKLKGVSGLTEKFNKKQVMELKYFLHHKDELILTTEYSFKLSFSKFMEFSTHVIHLVRTEPLALDQFHVNLKLPELCNIDFGNTFIHSADESEKLGVKIETHPNRITLTFVRSAFPEAILSMFDHLKWTEKQINGFSVNDFSGALDIKLRFSGIENVDDWQIVDLPLLAENTIQTSIENMDDLSAYDEE